MEREFVICLISKEGFCNILPPERTTKCPTQIAVEWFLVIFFYCYICTTQINALTYKKYALEPSTAS